MLSNLNKSFNHYFKNWAFVSKNSTDLQHLLNYINIFSSLNLSYPNSLALSNQLPSYIPTLQILSPQQLQFLLVELSLSTLSPNHRKVLSLRYIHSFPWDIISFKMNFSRRSCFYLRKDVLINLNNIYNLFCTLFAPIFTNLSL